MIDTLLIEWYSNEKRALPWRKNSSPYAIWISEIMLQQTRVQQVIGYYNRFMEAFPDIHKLAKAPEEKVLKLWQGLGYYSRARNIHKTARIIDQQYQSQFPSSFNDIISLPGIGPYTAGAIASIAFNLPVSAVDGNVQRVISRLFQVREPVNTTKGNRIIKGIVEDLLPKNHPGDFNQAIMDFGALICKPLAPQCNICPLKDHCLAFKHNLVKQIPVKTKTTKTRKRFFNYFIIIETQTGATFFTQRNDPRDIWFRLFEFPMIETDRESDPEALLESAVKNNWLNSKNLILREVTSATEHLLSHQKIITRCLIFENPSDSVPFRDRNIFHTKNIDDFPTHSLTLKIIQKNRYLKKNLSFGG